MKRIVVATVAFATASVAAFAEVSVTADFATAYVFRGATIVDDLVVQPAIEASGFGLKDECGSIAFGAWGSTAPFDDDYDNLHETDWYLSYTLPELVTNLSVYFTFTEYQYVAPLGEKEVAIGADYSLGEVTVGGSANFMIDDENPLTENQKYFDLFAEVAIEVSEEMDVTVGGLASVMLQGDGNSSLGLDDGFNHYEFNAALSYALNDMWSIGASLAYIGQLDSDVLPDAVYDRGLVAMFSIGCDM